ncbi:flagellar basal body L-ring protein FlgH [Caulobacter sp. SLTY]|uniref:flagellar basal body L-ring protein FlgH n=1 Tax=Caulobacter sp. SLTY TaxID=2683262 RepID=UPI001412E848|nr:flagellar basal body L-ring protein FlgH [Caulobacter sp. SLTY]NBB17195.1 flagellar basal body L-ring protein FlgH [Caulobacter sp. SLTY]
MRTTLLAVLALVPLAACATVDGVVASASDATFGPKLAPVGYPAALVPQTQNFVDVRTGPPQPASANSLWRTGARAFFNDQRAGRVGDILTVNIDIDDSAQTQNSSSTSRTNGMKAGMPHFFGLEGSLGQLFPGGFDPANAIETNVTSGGTGTGAVARSEKISLTIAAVVTGVLPNGNLVIQGTQEVRTNNEVRRLTVSGIVRPEDISSTNTVKHTQIAEARISYGGRGDQSRVQKTPAGQALVETFSPF